MNIQKATLNELNFLTELFDSYRVFYKQESDFEGARAFLKERLINEDSLPIMKVIRLALFSYIRLFLLLV
jgi:hypothetical protein